MSDEELTDKYAEVNERYQQALDALREVYSDLLPTDPNTALIEVLMDDLGEVL